MPISSHLACCLLFFSLCFPAPPVHVVPRASDADGWSLTALLVSIRSVCVAPCCLPAARRAPAGQPPLYVLQRASAAAPCLQANGLASQAQYVAGSIPSLAASQSNFIKAHAY